MVTIVPLLYSLLISRLPPSKLIIFLAPYKLSSLSGCLLIHLSMSSAFIPIPESSILIINLAISCLNIVFTDNSTNPFSVYLYELSSIVFKTCFRFILSPYKLSGRLLSILNLKLIFLSLNLVLFLVTISFSNNLMLYLVFYCLYINII